MSNPQGQSPRLTDFDLEVLQTVFRILGDREIDLTLENDDLFRLSETSFKDLADSPTWKENQNRLEQIGQFRAKVLEAIVDLEQQNKVTSN